jgi:hypothetical protein
MNTAERESQPGKSGLTIYCRQCRYNLRGVASETCPECGAAFDRTDETTFALSPVRAASPLHLWIGLSIILTMGVWLLNAGGDWMNFLDIPSALWTVGMTVGVMWMSYGPMAVLRAIRAAAFTDEKQPRVQAAVQVSILLRGQSVAWAAGLIGFICNLIILMRNMSDPSMVGPAVSCSLLVILYGSVLAEFFFGPLAAALAVRSEITPVVTPLPVRPLVGLALAAILILVLVVVIALLPV